MVMATAGTPEDENIENRPKARTEKERTMPAAGVGSITLLQGDDSEDEEERGTRDLSGISSSN